MMHDVYLGETEESQVAGDRQTTGDASKVNVDELAWVQRAMEVGGVGDRRGNGDACCVHGLPSVVAVHATRDLLDQNWSETLAADLLVDAEEVHLHWQEGAEPTSTMFTSLSRTWTICGTAVMNPISAPVFVTRMPMWYSFL